MATFGIKVTNLLFYGDTPAKVGDPVHLHVDPAQFVTVTVNPVQGTIRGVSAPITVLHPETGDKVLGREYTIEVADGDLPSGASTLDESDLIRIEAADPVTTLELYNLRTSSAANPVVADQPTNQSGGIHKNTSSGTAFVTYNDNGTMKFAPMAEDIATLRTILGIGSGDPSGMLDSLTPAANTVPYFDSASSMALLSVGALGSDLLNDTTAAQGRATLGVVIGTDVQAFHANLSALAGLTGAADRMPYFTGAGTMALAPVTPFARTLLDDADAATARATLGVASSGDKQDAHENLTALSSLTAAADKLPYFSGAGPAAMSNADLTAFGRSLIDDADALTARGTLGAQAQHANLTALAGLTGAADQVPIFTGPGAMALMTVTSFASDLLNDANAATARTTLGVSIGSDVQAYHANLAALAGLTGAADRLPYFTGVGAMALGTLSAFGRTLIDDADATTARNTLVLGAADNVTHAQITGTSFRTDATKTTLTGNVYAGSASIGAGYAATAAPTNGMIVEGRFGIGQPNPQRPLGIVAEGVTSGTHDQIRLSSLVGAISNGDLIGGMQFVSQDNNIVSPGAIAAFIRAEAQGTHAGGDFPSKLVFGTSLGAVLSAKMMLDANGRLGIGVTTASAPGALLSVGENQATTDLAQLILNDDATMRGEFGYNEAGNSIMHIANTKVHASATMEWRMQGKSASNTKMRLLGSGYFGIGDNITPVTRLTVDGAGVSLAGLVAQMALQHSGPTGAGIGGAMVFGTGSTRYAGIKGSSFSGGQAANLEFYTRPAAGNLALAAYFTYDGGFAMPEVAADPAAIANAGVLFYKDNGAGKTQLMVRFPSGASQQIAIEP